MASTSNEISQVEENPIQTQNQKVNVPEDVVKPSSSKSPTQDQNKKKQPFFTKPFKMMFKNKKPTKGNTPNPQEEAQKHEEEDKKKAEEHEKKAEEAKKKAEEREKEIDAITKSIKADFQSIENAEKRIEMHREGFKEAQKKLGELKDVTAKDLRDFKKVVKTMKQQISSQDKTDDGKEAANLLDQIQQIATANKEVLSEDVLRMMPNLFEDSDFERTLQFQDFKARYDELPFELKLCLLSFSVFPENVEIKRRVLVYWWIGEGFAPPRKKRSEETQQNKHLWEKFYLEKKNPGDKECTPEHWANHYFKTLLDMGFVESAQKKPNPKVDIIKMHPFIRSMLNRIAKEVEFFEFDGDGSVNDKFSRSLRACLLYENDKTLTEDAKVDDKGNGMEDQKPLKSLHSIVNVDQSILDLKYDSLSKMRNANVLYLGRWQNLGTHHIEVADPKILDAKKGNTLDGLQNIKNLKFLSLQGISRITELPKSILKLQNLTILDIRACHNLETIHNDIGCLENLTHLDMSECYLLDEMPKGISKLKKLQVLSGFVVLESENKKSCMLADLKEFPDLRKLSIHSGSDNFPKENDLKALNQFPKLTKLTIAWGRGSVNTQRTALEKSTTTVKDNEEESNKGGIDTVEQGNSEGNLEKEHTSKSGEITKEVSIGIQVNDQIPEKDNLEGQMNGDVPTNQERTEKSKGIKGKSTPNTVKREIVSSPNLGVQDPSASTSRQVAFSPETVKKDLEKTKTKTFSQEVKFPEKNKDLAEHGKGLLGRGLKSKLMTKMASKKIDHSPAELPSRLKKLDLQRLPEKTHNWLRPDKLKDLEKLYIRGGKFSDLGQYHDLGDSTVKWKWDNVKELRLKYLDEVEMEWRELLELFPKLDYLEKVDCPKLSFFPCDEIGVWMKKKTISEKSLEQKLVFTQICECHTDSYT